METYFIARLIRGPFSDFGRPGRRWGGLLAALFVLYFAGPGHLVQGAPSSPSTGDVYARLAGLESRTTELDAKLAGACALHLETVGSTEGAERAIKSFDAITLEAAGIKAALTELTDLLKKASAQVTVEGGGDLIEGRKKQKENLESKIATCENLIRVSEVTTPKAAKLKTIFSEAVAFRKAVADLYGKSTADSETRAVAEKSVTAIVGPLVNRPPMLQPYNLSPVDETKANSAASVVSTPNPVWILLGIIVCLVLVLAAKRGKWGKSKGGAPPVPPSKAPIPPPTPPTPPTPPGREVELKGSNGKVLKAMIASKFGRASLKLFGPDYEKYLSPEQFRLYQAGGAWFLEHCPGAVNQTNVNGKQLTVPVALKNGMTVTVGKSGMCPITFRVA